MTISMERSYRLRWMDFDRYGRMQPTAILDIFQDLAIAHAEQLGIGRAAMLEKDVVWVVVRTKFEVVRPPVYDTVVTVRTWPHSLSRFSFIRDFSMRDADGNELIKATQEWVLMNYETRKFASAKDAYQGPPDFDDARAFDAKPRKIMDFEAEGAPALVIVPAYTDIDVNGHVNNAMYGNYIINAINPSADGAMRTFQVDYRREVLPDVALAMHVREEGGSVRVKAVDPDGHTLFMGAIEGDS